MAVDARRDLGARGERLAAEHLAGLGYSILERNFRTRYGELDLVASTAAYLVFCEVKTRLGGADPSPYGALASIGAAKRRQVRLMAAQWLAARSGRGSAGPPELRFDAVGITLDRRWRVVRLEHMEGAF